MIEKEINETYSFNPDDFNEKGRRESDGLSFRDLVKDFEYDFHRRHSTEYALNLYCNSRTMGILERACDAAPFMMYGMDLTQGNGFDAINPCSHKAYWFTPPLPLYPSDPLIL